MLDAYREHVAERAAQNIPPKPLNAEQVAGLVELLKNPPSGEESFLLELISSRVPPGVDEAAYVKAGFLSAIARGDSKEILRQGFTDEVHMRGFFFNQEITEE